MNIEKALFNIQRIQILQSKLDPSTSHLISNDYAYAWSVELFPLLESTDLHNEYESQFKISREEIDVVTDFADSEWLKKKYYSFYQYEDMFIRGEQSRIKTERWHLIVIFRYMFLREAFDGIFWKKLTENGNCPVEAFGIVRNFDLKELSLI